MGNEVEKRHKRGRPRNSEVGLPVRDVQFSVRVTSDGKEKIDALSKHFNTSRSGLIDMLLKYADVMAENGAFDK